MTPNKVETNLEILEVRPEDAGTYFCNVETYGEPLDQAHTLDVLVPPSVQVQDRRLFYIVSISIIVTGTTLQWEVCRPRRVDDHLGVQSTGQPNAQGRLDQTGDQHGHNDDYPYDETPITMMRRLFIKSLQNSMMPSGEKSRVGSSVVVEQVLTDDHDEDDDYHHHHHHHHNQQKKR